MGGQVSHDPYNCVLGTQWTDIKLLRAMAVLYPVARSKICIRLILIQNFPVLPPLA